MVVWRLYTSMAAICDKHFLCNLLKIIKVFLFLLNELSQELEHLCFWPGWRSLRWEMLGLCSDCVLLAKLCLTLLCLGLNELSRRHGSMTGLLQKAGLCNNNKAMASLLFGCWDSRESMFGQSVTVCCITKWNVLCHMHSKFAWW